MGILGRLFGRSASTAPVASGKAAAPVAEEADPSAENTASPRALVCDEAFAEVDTQMVLAVRHATSTRVAHMHDRFLEVFDQLLHSAPAAPDEEGAAMQLEILTEQLASWVRGVPSEVHTTITGAMGASWGLAQDEDPLERFFAVYANASHYDSIILESAIRSATHTFDAAVAQAVLAVPSLRRDDVHRLYDLWDVPLLAVQHEWAQLHRDRLGHILRSPSTHDRPDLLSTAMLALFRAHVVPQAANAARRYRHILLPIVTEIFAAHGLVEACASLDLESQDAIREMAFEGYAEAQFAHAQDLRAGYLCAWFDTWRRREESKTMVIADSREDCARELSALNADDEFARFGAVYVDEEWNALFTEIRGYYAQAATAAST